MKKHVKKLLAITMLVGLSFSTSGACWIVGPSGPFGESDGWCTYNEESGHNCTPWGPYGQGTNCYQLNPY